MDYAINDLVWTANYSGREVPGQIVAVHTAPGQPDVYDVYTTPAGVISADSNDMRPITVRPAPNQQWQCTTIPDLIVTVRSVERGGLYADCLLPSGAVSTVILHGHYELVGGV